MGSSATGRHKENGSHRRSNWKAGDSPVAKPGYREGEKMKQRKAVPDAQLRRRCNPGFFTFSSTAEVPPLEDIVGQERAIRAVEFGLRVSSPGYNIYLSGLTGTGKTTYARAVAQRIADGDPVPHDWCYVHNFSQPDMPLALHFPPGLGSEFCQDIKELVEDLRNEIPKVFDSEDNEHQRSEVLREHQEQMNELFNQLEKEVQAEGFILRRTNAGLATVPALDGQPLSQEGFASLGPERQEEIERRSKAVQARVAEALRQGRNLEKEARQRIKDMEKEVGLWVVGHPIERLLRKYEGLPRVVDHLQAIKQDVVENLDSFRAQDDEKPAPFPWMEAPRDDNPLNKYKVNLFVDNSRLQGAPVVFETNPSYYNLIGQAEYKSHMGGMFTDFTMIKAGALHRANGGYLILQVADVLRNAGAWEALKLALKNNEVRIENLGEQFRPVVTAGLKPEPIPIRVKVMLIGNPHLYYLLYNHDEDFRKLFKIKADFEVDMARTPAHMEKYATFISSLCHRENLRHFDPTAVARVVEYSSRLAGDQEKLSTRFNEVVEIIYEASAWASQESWDLVSQAHVDRAISEKIYRSNKPEERLQELIHEGKILVDTAGNVVGQVNGLAVLDLGEYSFGKPSRITAKTFMGEKGVVNIEREIELSGAIHNKGVLTLSGYLGGKYAQETPLSLSASITFEQLYEGVEGDSASSTELYALLSSLSGLPIDQGIAVTGSVNQNGEIQPIGGVNQKIEGFFAVCQARGLTGNQGVIIPHQNVGNLMLKDEVVEAVAAGTFHVWAVATIDEGIELLTGTPAGEMTPGGRYPENTVHALVADRLQKLARGLAGFARETGRNRSE